ncbi:ROK family protein [Microbacterium sp. NPDC089698]|uniref:ROK family protein n=1 Tax=Microbacterium sp. NPDC089698 TaxID=3364200 RepID=UPI00380E2581
MGTVSEVWSGGALGISQSDNARRLLTILHREGPRSRAQLTTALGLNRSTVAALVIALADAQLAFERAPELTQRAGRPSPLVSASPEVVAIAANPEVDGIRMAAIGLDGTVRLRRTIGMQTVPTPEQAADAIARTVSEWQAGALAGALMVGIGVAVPGLVRLEDGRVMFAPHLSWRDVPFADLIAQRAGLMVEVGNDASLGALAEHRFGAGIGHEDVVYLNGGPSGIGGGVIVRGELLRGATGYAGEFGHLIAPFENAIDRRTASGKLEDEVNPALLAAGGAREASRQLRVFAGAVSSAINVLDPTAVILGGGLADLVAGRRDEFSALVSSGTIRPDDAPVLIVAAALAEDRLLVGAAELAFAQLLGQPGY